VVVRRGIDAVAADVVDVLLVGEIASPGNFRYDRVVKHGDYAAAGSTCGSTWRWRLTASRT
jgi:hypothetical protein